MKNRKGYKIFNFIMKLISWCVMAILCTIGAFLIVYLCINKIAQSKGQNAPLGLYTIISPSMTPEIDVYDVVVVVYKDPSEIEVGDIISYYSTNEYFGGTPITHRVVEKFNTNNGVSFRTRGDANPVVDNEIIMQENVIGTVRFRIPQLGRIQFFLASKGGWFIAILIPAAGIIIYDLVKLSKLMAVKNKMKYAEDLTKSEIIEKEKNKEDNTRIEKTQKRNEESKKVSREEKYKSERYGNNKNEVEDNKISRLFEDLDDEEEISLPPTRNYNNSLEYNKKAKNKTSKR